MALMLKGLVKKVNIQSSQGVLRNEMSDVMFTVSQMSGRVRGERGRAWAAPPQEAAVRASRAAVLRQF